MQALQGNTSVNSRIGSFLPGSFHSRVLSWVVIWFLILAMAQAANAQLTVNAGEDAIVEIPAAGGSVDVTLKGSYDAASPIKSILWSGATNGVVIESPDLVESAVKITVAGDYNFKLTVLTAAEEEASDNVRILVRQAPAFFLQPSDANPTVGATATFSVSVTGYPTPTLQWQKNGIDIPGATAISYTTPATTMGDSGSVFRAIASNEALVGVTSNNAILRVNRIPPTITTHPGNASITVGDAATFTITAAGTGPLTYRWYRNSVAISDAAAASATYTFTPPESWTGSTFFCRVTNAAGVFVNSNSATLTVNPALAAPSFEAGQIVSISGRSGQNITPLVITAKGNPTPNLTIPTLPAGLVFTSIANSGTGTISGNTTVVGTSTLTVVAANGVLPQATLVITLSITQPPVFTSSIWTITGTYGQLINPVTFAASGTPAPSFSLWQPLPAGLNLDAVTGIISGTPTTAVTAPVTVTDSIRATNTAGTSSHVLTITINPPNVAPTITTQPLAQTVNAPAAVTFSVIANGYPALSYQWQRNGTTITNAVSSSYTIPTTSSSNNQDTYRVLVSNTYGGTVHSVTSSNALLTVRYKPIITSQPLVQNVVAPAAASFSVIAIGSPDILTYQWRFNGVAIPGATLNSYTRNPTSLADNNGKVTVVVGNSIDTTISTAALLTVTEALTKPAILTNPISITRRLDSTASFSVTVTGNPAPTLQWQRGNVAIVGETGTTYSFKAKEADNQSQYRAVATNSQGSATSSSAVLTVEYAPKISLNLPTEITLNAGQTASFQVTATGNPNPTFQWYANNGTTNSKITGATTNPYSRVVAMADSGLRFTVVLTNPIGNLTSTATLLRVNRVKASIKTGPIDQSITEGQNATFSVVADGTAPFTYQWRRNSSSTMTDIAGAIQATYTISNAQRADSGATFDCAVNNGPGSSYTAYTGKATLHVKKLVVKPIITNTPLNIAFTVNNSLSYQITTTGTTPKFTAKTLPPGLKIVDSTGLISGTPTQEGVTRTVITASNSAGVDSVTLVITISAKPLPPTLNSKKTNVATVGKAYKDTLTALGTGPFVFGSTSLPSLFTLDSITGIILGTPSLKDSLIPEVFQIEIRAKNAQGQDIDTLILTINPKPMAPKINSNGNLPETVLRNEGETYTFAVVAKAFPAPTYTWQNLTASGPKLLQQSGLSTYPLPLSGSSSGDYRVIVSNGVKPDDTSKTCHLTVKLLPVKPTIQSQPPSGEVDLGGTIPLAVAAKATGTISYQWRKNGTQSANNILGATEASLTITNAQLSHSGTYYCVVSGSDVIWSDTNTYAISSPANWTVNLPKIDIPKSNYPDTIFTTGLQVTLTTDTLGDTIRYVQYGIGESYQPNPTALSPILPQGTALPINATTTLKAQAFKSGLRPSDVLVRNFTKSVLGKVTLTAPSPSDSVFSSGLLTVKYGVDPKDAQIWYTSDGSVPSVNNPPVSGNTSKLYQPDSGIKISATTTLLAKAFKASLTPSDVVAKHYILQKSGLRVVTPSASPAGSRFLGSISVFLSTPTDSAHIWYTLDGSSPYTSNTKKEAMGTITISSTLTLKAMASREGNEWLPSDSLIAEYKRIPGPLVTKPASDTEFGSPSNVKVEVKPEGTPIYCTTDNSQPLDEDLQPSPQAFKYTSELLITESTTLLCVAIGSDKIPSDTLVRLYGFTPFGSRLITPHADPSSRSFRDTMKVSLRAGNLGAKLYYTTNGEDPDPASLASSSISPSSTFLYTDTVTLDTTTTIRAIAVKDGYLDSRLMVQTYTLFPDTPQVNPRGGIYVGQTRVVLSHRSKKVDMYYTLNGETPNPATSILYTPGDSIVISSSSTLKAIAVSGNLVGSVRVATYTIANATNRILDPGTSFVPEGSSFTLLHQGQPAIPVEVGIFRPDSLNISGFSDLSFGIRLTPIRSDGIDLSEMPIILLVMPNSETRALYRLSDEGKVQFISTADSIFIRESGVYFLGRDILAPVVTFTGDRVLPNDSTEIGFTIHDNVTNLLFDFIRSDAPKGGITQAAVMAPGELSFRLKALPGEMKALMANLTVTDGTFSVRVPDGANQGLILAQSLKGVGKRFGMQLGVKSARGWDLVSLPVDPVTPVTEGAFWKLNPVKNHLTMTYVPKLGTVVVKETDTLIPGRGYWMAANPALDTVTLPTLLTKAVTQGEIRVRLKKGWNLIGLSSAQKMYWPYPRSWEKYSTATIRAPHSFSPIKNEYVFSDSLEPWRGYWVFSYPTNDTSVLLSQTPVAPGKPLQKSVANTFIHFRVKSSHSPSLELGAMWGAKDQMSSEDEPAFPDRDANSGSLTAIRDQQGLSADWVAYKPGSLMSWSFIQRKAILDPGEELENEETLNLEEAELPTGYEAALISKQRRIMYPFKLGTPLPSAENTEDTLSLWAAPSALLKQALAGFSAGPPAYSFLLKFQPGNHSIQLSLPVAVQVSWLLCDSRGHVIGQKTVRLAEGNQRLNLDLPRLSAGVVFLRVAIRGRNLQKNMTYRLTNLP